MVKVIGLPVDLRHMPRDIQKIAFAREASHTFQPK
jgi:hypothetical protein